jgi:hypothetical protein
MKQLVNGLQYLIVLIIIYPIYYVWQVEKVVDFCEQIDSGMSKQQLVALAEQENVYLDGPNDMSMVGGKWIAVVKPGKFVSADECVIKGAGKTIATARLFEQ